MGQMIIKLILYLKYTLPIYGIKVYMDYIKIKNILMKFICTDVPFYFSCVKVALGGDNMNPNHITLILCTLLSFTAALIRQLYDLRFAKKSIYIFVIDVLLSGISGLILALILAEFTSNELTIIGLSGLGGIFGMSGMKTIMKINLGKRIKIQIGFDDDKPSNK